VFKWLAAGAAVAVALPLTLLLLATAAPTSQASMSLAGGPSVAALSGIPPAYLSLYMSAARMCPGLPWGVLAGIGEVESGHSQSTAPGVHSGANYAGAEGPMQFEPATFAQYAVDGDHDGQLSPYDPADAIYTAAAMLCANGAASGTLAGIRQAVFAYNHSQAYVSDVLGWAARYTIPAPSGEAATRDRVRAAPDRQALPMGRYRAGRLRLLGPGLRRLRRRGHPHRPYHLRLASGRASGPPQPDPARRPSVFRRLRRHAR
jgi:transglycosylase-like protein with SLT domain